MGEIARLKEWRERRNRQNRRRVDPKEDLLLAAYACAEDPTDEELTALIHAAMDRGMDDRTDPRVWFASAIYGYHTGATHVYDDIRRMVWCRKEDDDYLVLALTLLAQIPYRNEAARQCGERVIETALRVLPRDEKALDWARTVNAHHIGQPEEEFEQRIRIAQQRARFSRR